MEQLFKDANLSFEQVQCMCRGLYALAHADGMDPREEALIRSFHDTCRPEGSKVTYEETVKTPFKLDDAKSLLAKADERALFLRTAYLLAFADRKITADERTSLDAWAVGLGIDADAAADLQAQVKDFLLGNLASRIKNTEAIVEVAKELNS